MFWFLNALEMLAKLTVDIRSTHFYLNVAFSFECGCKIKVILQQRVYDFNCGI